MKTRFFTNFWVLLSVLILSVNAFSQTSNTSLGRESVTVLPAIPQAHDSIVVAFTYVSTDGCPDFYLVVDAVVDNKLYVNPKSIQGGDRICTMAITTFTTRINLGLLKEGTEIYFRDNLIHTLEFKCVPNRVGIVVEGVDRCAGELLIREKSITADAANIFYKIQPLPGQDSVTLKPGDRVKFAARRLHTTPATACRIIGVAVCYEIIAPINTYNITGLALAGSEVLMSGRAVLIRRDIRRTWAVSAITNGKFSFANIPEGIYTVYVMPARPLYRKYLPTFYVDKLRLAEADFFTLKEDFQDLTVVLREAFRREGGGRIHGNISFETEQIRDSLMAERHSNPVNKRSASNIPVVLFDSRNRPVAWTLTDDEGDYHFDNLALDRYRIVPQAISAEAETEVVLATGREVETTDLTLRAPAEVTSSQSVTDNAMQVFPNPFTDVLFLNTGKSGFLYVYNAVGQLLHKQMVYEGENQVDLSSMKQGMLLLKTPDGNFRVIKK